MNPEKKSKSTDHFSGSYLQTDVHFLLNIKETCFVSVEEKERLIQSGQKHYSDLITKEQPPTELQLEVFNEALTTYKHKIAGHCLSIASSLMAQVPQQKPIVLISFVRAGAPFGVLLKRAIEHLSANKVVYHYGISIIRDRDIDLEAMAYIMSNHADAAIFFVDGWTGKGAISGQLQESLKHPSLSHLDYSLIVLSDPAGVASLAPDYSDWLIPFGILGSVVSGLISRTLWSDSGYHFTTSCDYLNEYDQTLYFVDTISLLFEGIILDEIKPLNNEETQKEQGIAHRQCLEMIEVIKQEFDIANINYIKPGIAEATRAVLRRVPDKVLVKSLTNENTLLLVRLARSKGIEPIEYGDKLGRFNALTIINKLGKKAD